MGFSQQIFRQYDVRGVVGDDLTGQTAHALGRAYAAYLAKRDLHGPIAVGRDNRPSGGMLRESLVRALTESGLDVFDIGIVPTPLLYWSLHNLPVGGGIQITGSHNPPEYNGFKLCVGKTSLHGDDIQELYRLILDGRFPAGKGDVQSVPVIDKYVQDIATRVGKLSRPLRVVVDCGNGVGSLVAPQLFDKLGVKWTGLFCESDGRFPNHHPDPTVVANVQDLIGEVKRTSADIGIAFDGDADRIGVVDGRGEIVWGDYILIVYARDVLKRTGKGQSIIFDVKCSQALSDEITRAGGRPVMWKTGHSLIKEKMKELRAPLAGEMSGHMFFTEGFYGHDDALYGAARLLRIIADSGRSIMELLSDVPRFVSTPELRVDVPEERKFAIVEAAVRHFRKTHEVIDVDGARVLFGDGWGLIRASNTQPVLVMRVEARTPDRLTAIRAELDDFLRGQGVPSLT
ncbi:MAG TPA: phosphomannomutase/phosphoglucomutase [Gemmatimonadaceae bacterium]|nr:phosphomannomutase/phosphoglucomutase [Gemmatimonadaceae bacterium]